MTAIAIIGALIAVVSSTTGGRLLGLALALAAIAGTFPTIVIGGGAAMVVLVARARTKQANAHTGEQAEIAALEALSLATTAGLPFSTAARKAAAAAPEVAPQIDANLRRWHSGLGIEAGQSAMDGAFFAAQRSSVTGARLAPTLRSQLGEVRRQRSERRRAAMARLPVKLLFPLVFLILPGFLLLAVVPTVVGGLSRLQL